MFAALLIGLREGLEAALVVGILVSYLVKVNRRDELPKLWWGVALAVTACLALGGILTLGSYTLAPGVEEIVAGTLSIVAVGLITWMIMWMARTSRSLAGDMRADVDRSLARGGWSIAVLAIVAVGREGIETTLFIWSAIQAAGQSALTLLGALIGLGLAVLFGYAIYRGILRINLSRFFLWTGIVLVIVAAGVLAYGIHDLQEAGVLPEIDAIAFDASAVLPEGSWYAVLLKGIFNFSPVTTVLEFTLWWAYVVIALTAFLVTTRRMRTKK